MADSDEASAPVPTESPTTPKKAAPKKPAKQAAHPATATMVNSAIENLKERGGSSLQAIKKYISSTYKVDAEKYAPFIRKYIKASVAAGALIQTKGKGASGSFKLATAATNKTAKPETNKSDKPKGRPRKVAVEKSPSPKKSPSPAKKATKTRRAAPPPSPKRAAKAKSPSKAKKTAKSPTKKPKSPKPKTTKKAAAKSPTRKAASPKKK